MRAAETFTQALNELLQPELLPLADNALKDKLKRVSWQLAGFMVLADWGGSDQALFRYYDEPMPLSDYWRTGRVSCLKPLQNPGASLRKWKIPL